MTDSTNSVRRRDYLKLTGGAVAASSVGLAGCLGSDDNVTGTLATQVTDQPGDIADFQSCVVTIDGLWVKPYSGDGDDDDETDEENGDDDIDEQNEDDVDQSDGRTYYEFDESQDADLVDLQGENTQLVDESELPVDEYEYLQLDIAAVDGTLENGDDATVKTPGNAPLQFNERFEIHDGKLTTFVADFTPVRRGQTDEYLLQPVARGTKVIYEDDE